MGLEPLASKWRAFGWAAAEIDGHDIEQILAAFRGAAAAGVPAVIIAHTIKGKGVPYMENKPAWHGSVKLNRLQTEEALAALGANLTEISELLDV
jgi:transketolase